MGEARAPTVDPGRAESRAGAGADGRPVRVYAWRNVSGRRPVLLWGHANGFAAGAYVRLLDRLAESFDVFAADLRGHGGSADPGPDYDRAMTADRLALDLVAVTAAVRRRTLAQPIHFAGHSVSGLSALRMGAVHGHAPFASMTLFEP
ncbi:MAG: alpha/beta fold hydrolase, partial [Alphaproteobacteria bacterium]